MHVPSTATPHARHAHLFRCSQWVGSLPAREQDLVLAAAVPRRYLRTQVIQQEQTPGPGLAWVVEGTVRVEHGVDTHGPTLLYVGQPGFSFGQAAILRDTRTWVTVRARTATTVLVVSHAAWQRVAPEVPNFAQAMLELGHWHARWLIQFQAEGRSLPPSALLASQLAALADLRAAELGLPATEVELDLTQDELGQLVGLARQQVNPRLKALADDGLVRLAHRRITVVSAAAIRAVAHSARSGRLARTAAPDMA